jgi:mannose-6-phosphate isomerase-like protein (cupin superfamily)
VERDLANPSLGTLKRIASALEVALPFFFQDEESESVERRTTAVSQGEHGPARVVRANRRKTLIYPGSHIHHQLLSPDLHGQLEAILVSAPAGTGSGSEPYLHEGEEIGFVVRGRAECRVGEELFVLEPGDAITINSTVPHSWRNSGREQLEMLWISTPPTF